MFVILQPVQGRMVYLRIYCSQSRGGWSIYVLLQPVQGRIVNLRIIAASPGKDGLYLRVIAASPGKGVLPRGPQVKEGPGQDDIVVGGQEEGDHHCAHPCTCS